MRAFQFAGLVAGASAVTPVEKVIQMMQGKIKTGYTSMFAGAG
jgi:hypothetical protein